jgi:hypothetical protein
VFCPKATDAFPTCAASRVVDVTIPALNAHKSLKYIILLSSQGIAIYQGIDAPTIKSRPPVQFDTCTIESPLSKNGGVIVEYHCNVR